MKASCVPQDRMRGCRAACPLRFIRDNDDLRRTGDPNRPYMAPEEVRPRACPAPPQYPPLPPTDKTAQDVRRPPLKTKIKEDRERRGWNSTRGAESTARHRAEPDVPACRRLRGKGRIRVSTK